MDTLELFIKSAVEQMGFRDYNLEIDIKEVAAPLFIYENSAFIKESLPIIVDSMNHVIQMVAKKIRRKRFF